MVKVSDETRRAILADRGKMPIKDLVSKYNLSKATIHRVLAKEGSASESSGRSSGETTSRVEIPTIESNTLEFINIIEGKSEKQIDEEEAKRSIASSKAVEKAADKLFEDDDEADGINLVVSEPMTPKPRRIKAPHIHFGEEEDPVERNKLEQRIILNIENFAPIFHFIKDKDAFIRSLSSKSMSDLQGLLKTLENTRTTVNLSNQMKQTFYMAARGTEMLGAMFLKLKTQGFTEQLMQQQQELDMIFREIAIEYAPMFQITTKPELRLGMMFAMTLIQTDSSNRLKETLRAQMATGANDNTDEEEQSPEQRFADL